MCWKTCCYSDLVALGAMHTLASRGLRVPEDVAIVGYDDIEDGRYANPPVTTICPDKKMIAETAVERLLKRIGSSTPVPGLEIRAPHRLVVRESTVGRRAAGAQQPEVLAPAASVFPSPGAAAPDP
ncbi:substrate-binding domain-containing protein [Streptomyces sp. NPDC001848]|uniref:substrate-binding domain-containing protein n=1 Tax=Streptomyces sp. NPDC001848 TaxID=3364618 RepID=UPI0036C041A4